MYMDKYYFSDGEMKNCCLKKNKQLIWEIKLLKILDFFSK